MIFNGDAVSDYIAARDITTRGIFPLISGTTDLIWLRQGPFFLYILGLLLPLFKYNPLAGGFFVAFTGMISVFVIYKIGCYFFSRSTGIFAALFYSTSPINVIFDRYPSTRSFISLTTMLLFISIYFAIKKNIIFLLLSFLFLGLLLQLELSNIIFIPVLLLVLYDFRREIPKKYILFGLFLFFFTWIPKIIYDLNHNFILIRGFLSWSMQNISPIRFFNHERGFFPWDTSFLEVFYEFKKFVFWPSFLVTMLIFSISLIFIIKGFSLWERKRELGQYLILLWLFFPLLGLFLKGLGSSSYLPSLFALPPLLIGNLVDSQKDSRKLIFIEILVFIFVINGLLLVNKNYFMISKDSQAGTFINGFGQAFGMNKEASKYIINDTTQ